MIIIILRHCVLLLSLFIGAKTQNTTWAADDNEQVQTQMSTPEATVPVRLVVDNVSQDIQTVPSMPSDRHKVSTLYEKSGFLALTTKILI